MNIIGFAILLLIVVVFSAMFPNALTDLAARIRTLRAGAVPLQRRGGYASHSHAEAYSAPVRQSPGHRNFGIPRSLGTELGSALTGRHPGLDPGAHILGDH